MSQYQNQRQQGYQKSQTETLPVIRAEKLNETNYVDFAEKVIKSHIEVKSSITTTQLRSLFSLMTETREIIRVRSLKEMDATLQSRIQYIKMRFVYAAGRGEKGVNDFLKRAALIECLNTVNDSPKRFELVCRYMEALVAYHKYYIDK